MQTANIMLALNDDRGNTVPKRGVTPTEAALLMAIHGEFAVFDVKVLGEEVKPVPRELLQEMAHKYGAARNSDDQPIIKSVFPTATSPLPQTFEELGLPDDAFLEPPAKPKPKARRAKAPAPEPEPEPEPEPTPEPDQTLG